MSASIDSLKVDGGMIYRLGGTLVSVHLLVDKDGAVLVDTGLRGTAERLARLFHEMRRSPRDLTAILLTHGHLDHTGEAARIQRETGAEIWIHSADQVHVDGRAPYRGWSRGCGVLEQIGRVAVGYEVPQVAGTISDGDWLPWWGGLRVVHLPGHTPGHCGFYCERTGWLLSGDLFASYRWSVHLPPRFLNRDNDGVKTSVLKAVAIAPLGIVPSHYDVLNPRVHWERLRALSKR